MIETKMTNSDNMLGPFLRNLGDSVDKNELTPRQLHSIGEFFMSYKFQEEAAMSGDIDAPDTEFSQSEMIKFLVLGWWVYSQLLRDKTLESPNLDIEAVD
jgi:hypothetical protein